tara:strand:+ start:642 stop:893 length:252 start_codon:yes stop_codon:yes gene_type:complete
MKGQDMKTIQEIQKDWAGAFDTVKLSSGEIVEGKAAFEIYLEEGQTVYQALSKTLREFISGKEIYKYCFENFIPTNPIKKEVK